jgi:hypothetical protein
MVEYVRDMLGVEDFVAKSIITSASNHFPTLIDSLDFNTYTKVLDKFYEKSINEATVT